MTFDPSFDRPSIGGSIALRSACERLRSTFEPPFDHTPHTPQAFRASLGLGPRPHFVQRAGPIEGPGGGVEIEARPTFADRRGRCFRTATKIPNDPFPGKKVR